MLPSVCQSPEYSFVRIWGEKDNELRPENVVCFQTPAEFREWFRAYGHKRRGQAGTKDTEAPAKGGKGATERSAVWPMIAKWGTLVKPTPDFKRKHGDAYDASKILPRGKDAVAESPATCWLDFDDMNAATLEALKATLVRLRLDGFIASTYSQGRADVADKVKIRLVLTTDANYPAGQIVAVREAAASMLAREVAHVGALVPDEKCLNRHTLFFLPATPDDDARAAAAFRWFSADYTDVLPLSLSALPLQASVEKAARDTARTAKLVELGKLPATTGQVLTANTAEKSVAVDELSGFCVTLVEHPSARGLQNKLVGGGAAYLFGRYARAGALPLGYADALIAQALERHADKWSATPERRSEVLALARRRLREGYERDASGQLPLTREETAIVKDETTKAALFKQLKDQVPARTYELSEAQAGMREAILQGVTSQVVVGCSTGVGKTHAAIDVAKERALNDETTVIVSSSHKLLHQIAGDIRATGIPVTHLRSPLAVVGNEPVCLRRDELQPVVSALGANLHRDFCWRCPFGAARKGPDGKPAGGDGSCEASRAQRRGGANIILAPYQLAKAAIDMLGQNKPLLIIDEEPPLGEKVKVSGTEVNELSRLDGSQLHGIDIEQEKVVSELASALKEKRDPTSQALAMAKEYDGELRFTAQFDAAVLAAKQETYAATRRLLQIAVVGDWAKVNRTATGGAEMLCVDPMFRIAVEHNNALLSATHTLVAFEKRDVQVVNFTAPDGCPGIVRELHYTSTSSRGAILRDTVGRSAIQWEIVERDLEVMHARLDEARSKSALLVTYKDLADALQTPERAHLLRGRDIQLAYYGNVRGLNQYKACDAFITMYDQWGGADQQEVFECFGKLYKARGWLTSDVKAWVFEQLRRLCAGELEQAHGRARDPRRTTPCLHMHFGRVNPLSWNEQNTVVIERERGRQTKDVGTDALAALEALVTMWGSAARVARQLNIPADALYRWRAATRPIPAEYRKQILSLTP